MPRFCIKLLYLCGEPKQKKCFIMKNFKVLSLALVGMMCVGAASAQDELETTVSADLVSNYVWRGEKLDDAAIQPSVGISYKGLSFSAWGSYGLTGSENTTEELDLTLAYEVGNFNVGITDYWSAGDKYFYYGAHGTGHIFEANVGYDFGPLAIQWYTNFAGYDYYKDNGKRSYSSYFEVTAPFELGGLDWEAAIGAVPYKANESCYADYLNAKNFAVTNVSLKATKEVKITDSFSIPLFAQLAANPSLQKAYFVFGITFQY